MYRIVKQTFHSLIIYKENDIDRSNNLLSVLISYRLIKINFCIYGLAFTESSYINEIYNQIMHLKWDGGSFIQN